jgi:hypothetical protein
LAHWPRVWPYRALCSHSVCGKHRTFGNGRRWRRRRWCSRPGRHKARTVRIGRRGCTDRLDSRGYSTGKRDPAACSTGSSSSRRPTTSSRQSIEPARWPSGIACVPPGNQTLERDGQTAGHRLLSGLIGLGTDRKTGIIDNVCQADKAMLPRRRRYPSTLARRAREGMRVEPCKRA